MTLFDSPAFEGHEGVHAFADEAAGLKCVIAVHSTARGPAAGGCRMWNYPSAEAALGSDYAARVKGYAFNVNSPDGIGDPANVAAPACPRQGPVFGSGFYFPQVNAGVTTPKLVP